MAKSPIWMQFGESWHSYELHKNTARIGLSSSFLCEIYAITGAHKRRKHPYIDILSAFHILSCEKVDRIRPFLTDLGCFKVRPKFWILHKFGVEIWNFIHFRDADQTSQKSIFKKLEGFKMDKIGGIFGGYQNMPSRVLIEGL